MIRVLLYFGLVAIIALGAAWLADRPGTLVLTWEGWRVETNLMVSIVAVAVVVVVVMLVWSLISAILRAPDAFGGFLRGRRRSRGITAVSRGLVAVGIGDARRAVREAAEARRYLGADPLALLLQAQAAQLSGDRDKAETAFQTLLQAPETRAIGLRGLFVEAERRGDHATARRIAEDAARNAPEAGWALDALFGFHCADRDWAGARDVVERLRSSRVIERDLAERRRAVLLTAEAQDIATADPAEARIFAVEAHKLAPDLVPAAALAARLLIESGDARRGAKIAETTFRRVPHPELADLYVNARAGESARDRLQRAEALATRAGDSPEGRLAIARAAVDARDFGRARDALEPLTATAPTMRTCLLMSDVEDGERQDVGRAREWLSRALHAPPDPVWVADGMVSQTWLPVSPLTGDFDAFRWQTPPSILGSAGTPTAAIAATERLIAASAPPEPPPPEPAETAAIVEASMAADAEHDIVLPPAEPPFSPVPVGAAAEPEPAHDTVSAPVASAPVTSGPAVTEVPSLPAPRAVLPLPRPPDDPGPDEDGTVVLKGRAVSLG